MQPKRVLCIQDICCVGRCSLAVVLPALCAMGLQACPLPTALLPTHPLGFAPPTHTDETSFCEAALGSFDAQRLSFDAVLVGYLAGEQQTHMVAEAFRQSPHALKVLDPVMADHGKLYRNTTPALCDAVRALARTADVLTPNVTESAVLLGLPPCDDAMDDDALTARMLALHSAYPQARYLVMTGARCTDARAGNVLLQPDADFAAPVFLPYEAVAASFPGTGDLFAALLTGGLVRTGNAQASVQAAAAFLTRAATHTLANGGEARNGVQFEPLLYLLSPT